MSAVLEDGSITANQAYAFARQYGLESWFDAHVVHPRTRQGRPDEPLKQREIDRFQRLQLLVERAAETFNNESKGLRFLLRPSSVYNGQTPLEAAALERGFLDVLTHMIRIEHGIPG